MPALARHLLALLLALALGACATPATPSPASAYERQIADARRLSRQRLLAGLLPGKAGERPRFKGGVDPLARGRTIRLLDELGITTGGVYSPSSGWSGTATSDLDMAGYTIADDTGNLTMRGKAGGAGVSGNQAALRGGSGNGAGADTNEGQWIASGGGSAGAGGDATGYGGSGAAGAAGGRARLIGGDGNDGGSTGASIVVTGGGAAAQPGTVTITGATTVTGDLSATGNTTLGNATSDTTTITGDASIAGTTSATLQAPLLHWTGGASTILTSAQCRGQTYYVGSGATNGAAFVLPDAPTDRDQVTFVCMATAGMTVTAGAGDEIETLAWTSATAGYLHTTRVGSRLSLVWDDVQGQWIATEATGTWRKDSTDASAVPGYAFTPTPWTAFTTLSHSWDADANISENGVYRHNGDQIEFDLRVNMVDGAPPSADLTFDLAASSPAFTIDETDVLDHNGYLPCGRGSFYDATGGATIYLTSLTVYYGTSANLVGVWSGGLTGEVAAVTATAPRSWTTNDRIACRGALPVAQ